MIHLVPGDQLWDRFKVESVAEGGWDGAWLSPLHPSAAAAPPGRFLLVPLWKSRSHVLAALLAALGEQLRLRALGRPGAAEGAEAGGKKQPFSKQSAAENPALASRPFFPAAHTLPFVGTVEWLGEPAHNGLAILAAAPAQPLAALCRATGALAPAQTLPLLLDLAGALNELWELLGDSAAAQEILRGVARVLQPEALALRKADARLQLHAWPGEEPTALCPPRWPDFAAPEIYQARALTPAAWVFGAARIAAFCLGVGAPAPKTQSAEEAWAALAEWAAGRRDLAREFREQPQAGALPAELRELLARCLAGQPDARPAHPAKLLAALRALQACPWAAAKAACPRCGFSLLSQGYCPCCDPAPPSKTKSSASLPRVRAVAQAASLPSVPEGMIFIPGGTYLSGERKTPRTLRAYSIDATPVTEGAYKKFLLARSQSARPNGPGSLSQAFDQHPVTRLNWFEANEYAEHLGKRLPTVHEWEKAARGVDGRKFPCGNTFKPGCGNLRASSAENPAGEAEESSAPAPVGSYKSGASPYGVLDMAGNVLEWTSSARRAGERFFRAVKGASYLDGSPQLARCAGVQYLPPDTAEPYLGFRCVKDVE